MALIFAESFDHYNTSQLPYRYNVVGGPFTTISPSAGRNGTAGLRVAFQNGVGVVKNLPVAATTMIVGSAITITGGTFGFGAPLLSFREIDFTAHVTMVLNPDNYITAYRGKFGGGTFLGTSGPGFAFQIGTSYYMEVKVVIGNAPDGSIEVRINGVTVMNLTGIDTRNGGTSGTVSTVQISNDGGVSQFGAPADWDDLVILDDQGPPPLNDFIGDVRVFAAFPTADGNYSDWSPLTGVDHYPMVNNNPIDNDTTYNSSLTPGDRDSFLMDAMPVASGTVMAVAVDVCARKDDSGTREISTFTRLGGTDDDGAVISVGESYVIYQQIFSLDPSGGPWSLADANAMECGYLEVS